MIKTAGTTLHYIFRNNYGINYVQIDQETFTYQKLKTLLSLNYRIKAIGGHSLRSCTNLHLASPGIKYITFLRDPADRFISHYNHAIVNKGIQVSFEDHINAIGEKNYQTKFLTGSMNLQERGYVTDNADLEKAKKIIANDFDFIGILEKFSESMVLMKKILNLKNFDIRFQKKNIAQKRIIQKEKIAPNILDKIREINEIDYELYNFAKNSIFERQKVFYGDDFLKDVEEYKISTENYKFKSSEIIKFRIGKFFLYRPLLKLITH